MATDKYENKWIPNKANTEWTMHLFPFTLRIRYDAKQAKPFVGALVGKAYILETKEWATSEEAAAGILQWAKEELQICYYEIEKMLTPGASG